MKYFSTFRMANVLWAMLLVLPWQNQHACEAFVVTEPSLSIKRRRNAADVTIHSWVTRQGFPCRLQVHGVKSTGVRLNEKTSKEEPVATLEQPPRSEDSGVFSQGRKIPSSTGRDKENTVDSIPGLGLIVLCSVPLVWGTYVPIVRLLYEIDPPIPGFLFSASYFFISSITTLTLSNWLDNRQQQQQQALESKGGVVVVNTNEQDTEENIARVLAGLELGSWLFMGNTLQLLGLKTVSSDRAGFLVQLTTILVPLMSALLAGNIFAVDLTTWMACIIALTGIMVMNLDLSDLIGTTTTVGLISTGDGLILAAALMYTMHVIRLGRWAPLVDPLKLAASKSTVETILSFLLVAVSMGAAFSLGSQGDNALINFLKESGDELLTFFHTVSERIASGTLSSDSVTKAVGATLWAGWVGTAYVIFAQSFGQRRVGASEANLIYSLQPLFTASFAYILLGETMDTSGYVGGGLILAAVLLVASKQQRSEETSE